MPPMVPLAASGRKFRGAQRSRPAHPIGRSGTPSIQTYPAVNQRRDPGGPPTGSRCHGDPLEATVKNTFRSKIIGDNEIQGTGGWDGRAGQTWAGTTQVYPARNPRIDALQSNDTGLRMPDLSEPPARPCHGAFSQSIAAALSAYAKCLISALTK